MAKAPSPAREARALPRLPGCKAAYTNQAKPMDLTLVEKPLFPVGKHYVSILGLIAFVLLFGLGLALARLVQSQVIRRSLTRLKIGPNLVAIGTTIVSLALIVFFLITAINAAGVPLAWSAPLPGLSLSLVQIFLLIGLLMLVFWISSSTKRFLYTHFFANSGLDRSLQHAISQIIANVVLIIGIFVVLENTGIHLGALSVFAGAVGVGVGFGLQNIASNFISGLVILAERPITIGDRVEVAGIAGQVKQIRARSTVVMTSDNIAIIIPNTKFIDSPVTNWTYGDPRVRFRLPVGVAYGSDVEAVRTALIAAGTAHPASLEDPPPTVFLEKFGNSSMEFELVVWSSEMGGRPASYRSDLNFLIEKHLREAGIEIPNPQRDLHIRSGVLKIEQSEGSRSKP